MASQMDTTWILSPWFIAVFVLGILASLLALCTCCRREGRKRALLQDSVRLAEVQPLQRPTEVSESAGRPQKLNRANSRGKDPRSSSVNLTYPMREDDGTQSVSSFTILTQRQLPQIPLEDLSATEETYSNLTFPGPTQEMLYESVTVKDGEKDPPSPAKAEQAPPWGPEDQAGGAEYARVQKVKKKEELPEREAGDSQVTPVPQPSQAKATFNPHTVRVEDMYSVVSKARKKTKQRESEGDEEERPHHVEMNHRDGQVTAAHQEQGGRAGPQLPPSLPPAPEPCYEPVSCESWAPPEPGPEPAYETVDTHWKPSRRKGKANTKRPAENLYESIENVTLERQNPNLPSRSKT